MSLPARGLSPQRLGTWYTSGEPTAGRMGDLLGFSRGLEEHGPILGAPICGARISGCFMLLLIPFLSFLGWSQIWLMLRSTDQKMSLVLALIKGIDNLLIEAETLQLAVGLFDCSLKIWPLGHCFGGYWIDNYNKHDTIWRSKSEKRRAKLCMI